MTSKTKPPMKLKYTKIINYFLPPLVDSSHVGVFFGIFVDQVDDIDTDHADTQHFLFTHPEKLLEKKKLQKSLRIMSKFQN